MLPINLQTKQDSDLVKNIKSNKYADESIMALSERHSALCHDIYMKYSNYIKQSGVCLDDVFKEKNYIIYKSALSYDESKKTKFSTWLANQVRFQCLNAMKNQDKCLHEAEDFEIISIIDSVTEDKTADYKDLEEYVINLLKEMNDARICKIFKMRYFNGSAQKGTLKQIAEKMKTTIQTISNLHSKGCEFLKEKMVESV